MRTVTLDIPDTLDLDNKEIVMLVATRLYEQGKLSRGQAAEVAGQLKELLRNCLVIIMFQYSTALPPTFQETSPMPKAIISDTTLLTV
jgi:hypothetical protein